MDSRNQARWISAVGAEIQGPHLYPAIAHDESLPHPSRNKPFMSVVSNALGGAASFGGMAGCGAGHAGIMAATIPSFAGHATIVKTLLWFEPQVKARAPA